MSDELIGAMKAALWEEAKGKLRALVAVSGSGPARYDDQGRRVRGRWENAEHAVETFIKDFESYGLHE